MIKVVIHVNQSRPKEAKHFILKKADVLTPIGIKKYDTKYDIIKVSPCYINSTDWNETIDIYMNRNVIDKMILHDLKIGEKLYLSMYSMNPDKNVQKLFKTDEINFACTVKDIRDRFTTIEIDFLVI